MRQALWITRFDWNTRDDLRALVTRAVDAGVTDLLMQARGAGDALYRSDTVPASSKIAGHLGGQLEWDPLEVVCDLAGGQRGVRGHAWLNVLSGWPATSPEACAALVPSASEVADHLLLRHPDAALVDERGHTMPCPNETDYVWVSPHHPAVISELEQVVTELVERYPLAGVHLDRIRYPGRHWDDRLDDSRRVEAVTEVVRAIRACVPGELELTASLVPDYGSGDGAMPDHLAEYGQDGWRWVEEGLVDSVMPMVYTPIAAGASDDWIQLVSEHQRGVGGDRCWTPVFTGLDATMIARQAEQAWQCPSIGVAWYSAGLIRQYDRWDMLRQSIGTS